ncbi:hypothetical protein MRX96_029576 [Rhipicephalus microplus]
MSAGHTRQQEDLTLRRAQVSQCSVDQHSLKELSTAGPSRTAQREPLLQSLATSRLSSNEVQADRPLHPAQRARPSDSQQAMEEIDLAGPSNLAQGEPAKLLSTSPKWMMGLQQQRSHQVQFEWQVTEQMGLPVPNLVPGAPAKAASVLAKSGMSLQEPQLHRTVPPCAARACTWPAADICTDPPSRSFSCNAESLASINCIVEQEQKNAGATARWTASRSAVLRHVIPLGNSGEQFPQQGGRQETTDSQISKEFPPEFSLVAGPSSPTASVGSAGYNLFEDDDDSGQGTVAFGKHIYVIGGYDGRGQVTSVERYDTDLDFWEMVAPPQHTKKCPQCRCPGRKDLCFRWLRWPGVPVYRGSVRPHYKCVDLRGILCLPCKSGQASCSSPAPCVLHKVS